VNARLEARLWVAQRISAMALGLFVLIHLATIVYAMRGGLSAAEVLSRTRGNAPLAAFYALFVVSVSVHAPIGLRAILDEWFALRGRLVDWLLLVAGLALAAWGLRAVAAVFAG